MPAYTFSASLLGLLFPLLVADQPAVVSSPYQGALIIDCGSLKGIAQLVCLANAFKATLSNEQQATVQRTYSKADAAKWSNFPEFSERPRRVGIRVGSLSDTQWKAAQALLVAAMA